MEHALFALKLKTCINYERKSITNKRRTMESGTVHGWNGIKTNPTLNHKKRSLSIEKTPQEKIEQPLHK